MTIAKYSCEILTHLIENYIDANKLISNKDYTPNTNPTNFNEQLNKIIHIAK